MGLFSKKNQTVPTNERKEELEKGVFAIKGDINDNMASVLIKQILDYSAKYSEDDITLYINSKGGSVTAGMAIYDVISYIPNSVSTIAEGNVGGIATVILAAGTSGRRFAYKGISITLGNFFVKQEGQAISQEVYSVIRKIYKVIAKHTKMTVEEIINMADSEIILDEVMAVKVGLIDNVMMHE